MENILYLIALVLVIFWAVGYWGYNAGYLIHILLIVALAALIYRVIKGRI